MENINNIIATAKLFLKLGIIGFGGPAAHIALVQEEVVVKKKWLSEQHFLDLIGATNLIPGPNSTEMAMHIGHEKAGWKGLVTAGICFIFPAVLITGLLAWLYKDYGQIPAVKPFLYGIKPAIISIVLAAVVPLAKKSFKTIQLGGIGVSVLILSLLKCNEIFLMFGAGIFALLLYYSAQNNSQCRHAFMPLTLFQVPGNFLISSADLNLFLIFLKIGAVLYGSGYVLFAFLDAELVAAGLLSRTQLIDAIAVGQFTPGPVFSSVTFIGYQINGFSGAVFSTIAIFLPSFMFVALLNPLVKKMRSSKRFSIFLDAVNAASIAIIIAVCFEMGRETIIDWRTFTIAIVSAVITFSGRRINSAFIVLGGAAAGYLLYLI